MYVILCSPVQPFIETHGVDAVRVWMEQRGLELKLGPNQTAFRKPFPFGIDRHQIEVREIILSPSDELRYHEELGRLLRRFLEYSISTDSGPTLEMYFWQIGLCPGEFDLS